MQTETVTAEQFLELAADMPHDQLPLADNEAAMWQEFARWEAASDEDWIKFETELAKEASLS